MSTPSTPSSFYVRRTRKDGSVGYVGPLPSRRRADREQAAWVDSGYRAEVLAATPALRRDVRAWQRAADARRS